MSEAKGVAIIDVKSECNKVDGDEEKENKDPNSVKKTFSGYKRKPVYNLDDNVIKVIRADNDVQFKLLTNNKGVFVDMRRYNRGFPTQKGVRVYASVFSKVAELLKDDINSIIPKADLSVDKLDKVISI